ncbi:LPXTG cell wall anchor domain-containing protein [Paenibacillus whitsoniae]|uniref:LPXTG cell wall anchor domain-containing protein n=1 Tax=Paenibacillus whitsoniae TaxID=2496558 RepID=A0A430JK97_9BACL|nr:LPXTG cell wall anchor domain-containing protein [Paenibacillus whitsoniae]RTE11448.1 LPXTG cell wall anchor domain-containing protein [Paenibacillus whitsoniae]
MRKRIALLLMTFVVSSILVIYFPSRVQACSCALPSSAQDQLSRSQAVFAGRVMGVKEQRFLNGGMAKAVRFEVSRVWKGEAASEIIIYTGSGGGDCGFDFKEGQEYLVYANPSSMYGDKELLVTIICDRTKQLSQAQEDLAVLGEGRLPTKQVNLAWEYFQLSPFSWTVLIGAAVVVIGGAVILLRRKRRTGK